MSTTKGIIKKPFNVQNINLFVNMVDNMFNNVSKIQSVIFKVFNNSCLLLNNHYNKHGHNNTGKQ